MDGTGEQLARIEALLQGIQEDVTEIKIALHELNGRVRANETAIAALGVRTTGCEQRLDAHGDKLQDITRRSNLLDAAVGLISVLGAIIASVVGSKN